MSEVAFFVYTAAVALVGAIIGMLILHIAAAKDTKRWTRTYRYDSTPPTDSSTNAPRHGRANTTPERTANSGTLPRY